MTKLTTDARAIPEDRIALQHAQIYWNESDDHEGVCDVRVIDRRATMKRQPSHFAPWSVAAGLGLDAFSHLSDADKRRLVRLMARVSEASFRRGYQHGVECGSERRIDPGTLRRKRSLDRSPWPDNPSYKQSSTDRLFMEYGVMRDLGFEDPSI